MNASDSPLGKLPLQPSTFVGREQETAEVKRLLGTTRLLTLTGVGGVGKTRLALHVADQFAAAYPDGVHLAELASLAEPRLVLQAVAFALGIAEQPGRSQFETLSEHLKVPTRADSQAHFVDDPYFESRCLAPHYGCILRERVNPSISSILCSRASCAAGDAKSELVTKRPRAA
jgi:hypothetical protein